MAGLPGEGWVPGCGQGTLVSAGAVGSVLWWLLLRSPVRSTLETPRLALAPSKGVLKTATNWEEGRLVVAVSLLQAAVLECFPTQGGIP